MTDYPSFLTSPLLSSVHAFSTRCGGVSEGVYASLNLGMNRGDLPENVRANWSLLLREAGFGTDRLVYCSQVHGRTVLTAGKEDLHLPQSGFAGKEADAMVTGEKNVPLAVFTADCVPLLLEDTEAGVVAAVHCGWRSTAADIEKAAVEAMCALGAAPERLHAAAGPAIGLCCFETGPEVPEAMEALLDGDTAGLILPGQREGKYQLDLRGTVLRRLLQLGLSQENIGTVGGCTMCEPQLYWSHRYTGGLRGSMASVIMRK